jgi:hypothetical protein
MTTEQKSTAIHQTKPEDRIRFSQLAAYGAGGIIPIALFNIAGILVGLMGNISLGLSAFWLGVILIIPRLWDALSDPVIGHLSDNTRTRWGRRRPFLLLGGILVAVFFVIMWWIPKGDRVRLWFPTETGFQAFQLVYILLSLLLFFTACNIFEIPHGALGMEMTTDYHERTRLFSAKSFVGNLFAMSTPWLFALANLERFKGTGNEADGMRYVSIMIAVVLIPLSFWWTFQLREPGFSKAAKHEVQGRPAGIFFEPVTERIYVFSHSQPNATVIEGKDGSIVGTIDLGGAPEQAASDGQGHLYVCLEDKDNIAVVDVNTLKVTTHYDLGGKGGGPAGLGLDAKNHILFAMCHDPQTCVILSAEDGKILTTLPIGRGTDSGGFNPNTMEAFSSQGDGTLTIIKESGPTSFEVEQTVQTKSRAKTCTLDTKNNRIILITIEPTPETAATAPPAGGDQSGKGEKGGKKGAGGGPGLLDILVVGQ